MGARTAPVAWPGQGHDWEYVPDELSGPVHNGPVYCCTHCSWRIRVLAVGDGSLNTCRRARQKYQFNVQDTTQQGG